MESMWSETQTKMDLHSFQVLTQDYEYFVTWKLVVSFEAKIVQFISKWIKMNSDSFHSKAFRAFGTSLDLFAKVYRAKKQFCVSQVSACSKLLSSGLNKLWSLVQCERDRFDVYVFIYRYFYWYIKRKMS